MKNLLGSVIVARKRSLEQGNVFTLMCHSVHGRGSVLGGSTSRGVCIQGVYLGGEGKLGRPPEIHEILRDTVNRRAVRILLECFLVLNKNTFPSPCMVLCIQKC